MLKKTMKKVFNKKINDWLSTIEDKAVVSAIKKDLIITGGAFTSMIEGNTPNDFDCYFRNKETVLKVSQYYIDKWNDAHKNELNNIGRPKKAFVLDGKNPSKELLEWYNITDLSESDAVMIYNTSPDRVKLIIPSDGIAGDIEGNGEGDTEQINADEELGLSENELVDIIEEIDEVKADEIIEKEKKKYFPVFISSNAITLSNKIQVVVRFYGEPDKIHDTYDFEHTKAYYDYGKGELIIPERVWELTINKTLIYSGSKYPVASLFRMRKFINRGWSINAGQILKMAMQTSELDLMNIGVLEDQLIGVDSLYFMSLIKQFRKSKEKDENFELTSTYVMNIVNKVFN